jgi:two-component system, NtrC family, sensor histidine kinase KinB
MSNQNEEAMLIEAGRMTARLVHDFKNQLSGLKLYAAYLKKRFAEQPEGVEIAEKIIQNLNEMAENAAIVGRLTRPLELRFEAGDLAALVRQVGIEIEARAAAQHVQVLMELGDNLPPFSFDFQHLRTALTTLVTRALLATKEGGQIELTLLAENNGAQLIVSDQGVVLTQEQRAELFAILTNERINKAQLELALARRIIELHNGSISARAAEPTGTAVEIILPPAA